MSNWYVVSQRWRPLTGGRYEITYISARTDDSNGISTATSTFSSFSNHVKLVPILPDVNGSRKSKVTAVKPEVHVSQLVDMIESKFQRHIPCFWGYGQLNGTKENVVRRKRKLKIQYGRRLTEILVSSSKRYWVNAYCSALAWYQICLSLVAEIYAFRV